MLDKIDHWLAKRKLTQAALEKGAGLAENRISKWRNATKLDPRAGEVLRIARFLDVPVEYLLDDEMEEPMPHKPALSPAEELAVKMVRSLGLSEDAVIRRLTYSPVEHPIADPTPVPRVVVGHNPSVEPTAPKRPGRKGAAGA